MGSKWYEDLYQDFGKSYEEEPYVQGTTGEVDFIEKELDFNKDKNILDIGCGTGRHSIELGRRGYQVTGIDLSESMLKQAEEKLTDLKADVKFIKCDALNLEYQEDYDMALILCEGAFSLMEADTKDYKILKNAYNALKKEAKLILTVPNAYKPIMEGNDDLDLTTLREEFVMNVEDDKGQEKTLKANQRYYLPSEIHWRLGKIGFNKIDIYGCELGNFNRNRKVNKKDMEFLVIAKKE